MNRIIQDKLPEVVQLCEQYHVKALYIFGSAARDEMTAESDVDFLVVFDKPAIEDYFLNFFDLQFALEDLFLRKIDLLADQAIRNPYLRRSVDRDKQLIYGRAS
jgi:predicted nucleotidyltransferase